MSMTDPIADMLTRIRNALMAKHDKVNIPISKVKADIAILLKEEGYIKNYKLIKNKKQGIIRVYLKYDNDNNNIIQGIQRISKPGNRVYVSKNRIPKVLNGLGVALISTSRGVLSDRTCRREGIGGEVIGHVW
ncbi:MAG: 30S ribosomal protein S8 [Nitrospinota bacterium]|nr:30S ribosomal protein S8 [Nitrospinota bacterium]MDP7349530.1 30S ribosomal protein S8 [Nitrospinota bacterium]HJN03457.1 30S ribosomal protein S8 [Nitrospinota bacterium]